MVEGHVEADVVFKLPNAEYAPVTICFEITGTAINGVDYEEIDNCITFEEGEDSALFILFHFTMVLLKAMKPSGLLLKIH